MSFSLAAALPQSYKICLVTQRLKLPNLAPLKKFDYALVRAPMVEERMLVQYKFQQFSRTALVVLAIATETDNYCNLGNREQAGYVWKMFVEHVPEGREMFEARYADLMSRKP